MNHWAKRIWRTTSLASIGLLLAAIAITGSAQTVASATVVPMPEISPAQVVAAGEGIVGLVDRSQFAELWKSASTATRKAVQPAQFLADLQTHREPLGAPASRAWLLVARQTLGADKGIVAGQYLNIEYETRFAHGDVRRELVSFRFDEDRIWRFAGYVLH